ncbi:aminopeptidase [Kribbella sp. NPDC048928]|uniref:aminopeptidase n=1 Tax=Kribbella sp. NPDC048928 TaxID=3364111 RepID=UPI003718209B
MSRDHRIDSGLGAVVDSRREADRERLRRFADLVVRVGVNIEPGQGVVVNADIAHAEVARAIVEQAYLAGASSVEMVWSDGLTRRSELMHATIENLTADGRGRLSGFAAGRTTGSHLLPSAATRKPTCSPTSTHIG